MTLWSHSRNYKHYEMIPVFSSYLWSSISWTTISWSVVDLLPKHLLLVGRVLLYSVILSLKETTVKIQQYVEYSDYFVVDNVVCMDTVNNSSNT